jgi:hypothetical protein
MHEKQVQGKKEIFGEKLEVPKIVTHLVIMSHQLA